MIKYVKMFVYMLAAYIITSAINLLLLIFEFILAMAPGAIHLPRGSYIDAVIWIMIGIHFVVSVLAYIYWYKSTENK